MSDPIPAALDPVLLEQAMRSAGLVGQVHHLALTASTNTLALAAAQAGAAGGLWVADAQSAGRGRGGHHWHSAPGDGLYVSLLVRPQLPSRQVLKLSLAAGLAARTAILATTSLAPAQVELRWPNDLMLVDSDGRSRKFGGILTESSLAAGSGTLAYAVVGIGINLNHAVLPPELAATATSARIVTGTPLDRSAVLSALICALGQELSALEREAAGKPGPSPLAQRFEQASGWVRGLRVHVEEDGGYTGLTSGLDDRCMLQVQLDDDTLRTVRHGGVRRV